jgi:hypothetical protein
VRLGGRVGKGVNFETLDMNASVKLRGKNIHNQFSPVDNIFT